MADKPKQYQRLSAIAPAESLVVPVFNPQDIVGKELLIGKWEFKVSEKGGDYVVFEGMFANTNLPFSCSSFDKAIVAQLAQVPEGTPVPLAARVEKFGRFYKLA